MMTRNKKKSKNKSQTVATFGPMNMNYNDNSSPTNWSHKVIIYDDSWNAVNHWVGNAPGTVRYFIEQTNSNFLPELIFLSFKQGCGVAGGQHGDSADNKRSSEVNLKKDSDQKLFRLIDILKGDLIALNQCPPDILKTKEDVVLLQSQIELVEGAMEIVQKHLKAPYANEISKILE
ncbi:MAG: hypothetical protein KF802_02805 [Bdellovibrionaceae bacterium]|nr:hypothetical protein [Pseudobdellovibrionaceae bacterium]